MKVINENESKLSYIPLSDCVTKINHIKWKDDLKKYHYVDLSSVDVKTHKIVETMEISSDNAPSRAQQIIQLNDILIGTTRPMLKRYCMVPEEYDGQICSTGYCVLRVNNENILPKWVYYNITTSHFFDYVKKHEQGTNYPSISDKILKKYEIPIPPLFVQKKIIEILDHFSASTLKLISDLELELILRIKQYSYYREYLYSNAYFKNKNINFTIQTFNEIGSLKRGKRFVKNDFTNVGIPCIHYGEIYTHYGIHANQTKSFVDDDLINKLRFAKNNDLIIVGAGETVGDIGLGVAWLGKNDVAVHDACYILAHEMEPCYISHFLRTKRYHDQITPHVSTGKISSISLQNLGKVEIPIIPLYNQKIIAKLLNTFDEDYNQLREKITIEISNRKKQYEYYRDKILSFESGVV